MSATQAPSSAAAAFSSGVSAGGATWVTWIETSAPVWAAPVLQPSRQLPDQRGQYRPVGPVQPGPRIAPAHHGDLVPQRRDGRQRLARLPLAFGMRSRRSRSTRLPGRAGPRATLHDRNRDRVAIGWRCGTSSARLFRRSSDLLCLVAGDRLRSIRDVAGRASILHVNHPGR